MNWPTRGRRVVFAVVAVLLAASAAGVAGGSAAGSHATGEPLPAVDNTTVNDTTDGGNITEGTVTNDTTDDATNTTDDATDTTGDTASTTGDATNTTDDATDTTDATGSVTSDTTTATEDATDATDAVAGTTEGATSDAVNATVGAAADATPTDDGNLAGSFLDAVDADAVTAGTALADTTAVTGPSTDPADSGTGASDGGEATGDGTAADREATAAWTAGTESDGSGTDGPSKPADPAGVPGLGVGLVAVAAGLLQAGAAAGTASLDLAAAYASATVGGPGRSRRFRLLRGGPLDRLHRFAAALRYSRHDASDPLAHDGRRAVHEAIEATPGVYLSRVAERADVPLSTTRHHVRVLADENLVTSAKIRGKRRYFPVGADADSPELHAALSEPATARVLEALADLGRAHVGLVADELDRDPSTVSHHLDRLADDGLVERERDGRAVMNRLAPAAERVLRGDADARASLGDD